MPVELTPDELPVRFAELAALVARGVHVRIRRGTEAFQLLPPLPPLAPVRVHTFTALPNGGMVRDDFDDPMELVGAAEVREWEAFAEWVRPFRPPHTPIAPTVGE